MEGNDGKISLLRLMRGRIFLLLSCIILTAQPSAAKQLPAFPIHLTVGPVVSWGVPGQALVTAFCFANNGTAGEFRIITVDKETKTKAASSTIKAAGVTFLCVDQRGEPGILKKLTVNGGKLQPFR